MKNNFFACFGRKFLSCALIFVLSISLFPTVSFASGGTFAGGNGSGGSPYQIEDCLDLQAMTAHTSSNFILINDIDCAATTGWNSGQGFAPGGNFTGSLNGQGYKIKNLFINRGDDAYVGLFNFVDGATIQNLGLTDVNITGSSYTGPLFGCIFSSGTLSHVYTTGTVHGGGYAGGVAGCINNASVSNSYSLVNVTGSGYAGGFAGYIADSTITNSYSKGAISAAYPQGFASDFGDTVNHVYYDSTTAGNSSGIGTAKTTAQMMTVGTFTGWTFTVAGNGTVGDWIMAGYPHLQMEHRTNITTDVELQLMDVNRGGDYTIANTITFDPTTKTLWDGGAGFDPIGDGNLGYKFTGTLNGQGHRIVGLYINRSSTVYTGLISNTFGAGVLINNIGLVDVNITGDFIVGGLVGLNANGTISKSYTTGTVSGNSANGGLVGYSLGNSAVISNSYSTATVTATTGGQTGGLVGINGNSNNSTIINSFSTGIVSGTADSTGGLVGGNDGTVTNSFYNTQTSGMSDTGKGTGKTTAQLKNVVTFTTIAAGLSSAWDFVGNPGDDAGNNDIWTIDGLNNNGYPFLSWQALQPATPTSLTISSITNAGAHIAWSDVSNNDGYTVDVGAGSDESIFPTVNEETDAVPNLIAVDWVGLSANTQYLARIGAYNDVDTSYALSDTFYTLADAPTALTVASTSDSSASLTWSGNGTSYVVSNDTLGTTTSSAGTSVTVTGLQCNRGYTFRVKALNGSGVETAYSTSVDALTSGCSGGGGSLPANNKRAEALKKAKAAAKLAAATMKDFSDISGHWAKTYIQTIHTKCDVKGYTDDKGNLLYLFGPNDSSTRAELVKMVVGCREMKMPAFEGTFFKDIDSKSWYAPYVSYAKNHGWVEGFADGGFHPNDKVTRSEAMKIILSAQYLDKQISGENNTFKDVDLTQWYYRYISFAFSKNFVSGYSDSNGKLTGIFGTSNPITRGEVAKIIVKVQGL
ncbi:MAG: S-layer homology domain-containing protein [Candidatus Peregrinibacteria bacterium]|nr:S-layer homology domain-containing protein [Candidatus Peregrinibacteria bacterium]